jgi:hypothetical protein
MGIGDGINLLYLNGMAFFLTTERIIADCQASLDGQRFPSSVLKALSVMD